MNVGVVVVEGGFASGVAAVLDVLGVAAAIAPTASEAAPLLTVRVLGARPRVRMGNGMVVLPDEELSAAAELDAVVITALGALDRPSLEAALVATDTRQVIETVRDLRGPRLAAACTATFALADAGRLDGASATTTWWLGPMFRARYPHVALDEDAMVVDDDAALTAGAAFAHLDLALALLRSRSPALAETVAGMLVLDRRASQAAYGAVSQVEHGDEVVASFERWARARLGRPLDLDEAAAACGVTRRTLERRTAAALGRSPAKLVERLRVEQATLLTRTTKRTLTDIAGEVGYGSASALRRAMTRAGV